MFSRRIVGWRTTDHLRTELVLDALDQAVYDQLDGPDAGIAPSIGTVGDALDNALAESIMIGLYKTELINRRQRWDSVEQVEWETMRWVARLNHDRIYETLGDIPPAEFETNHYRKTTPTEPVGVR